MKCTNPVCVDGRAPRDPSDPLGRFGPGICDICGGSGSLSGPSGLGNVGLGRSKVIPSAAPKKGSLVRELAAKCSCQGGTGPCTGNCCG